MSLHSVQNPHGPISISILFYIVSTFALVSNAQDKRRVVNGSTNQLNEKKIEFIIGPSLLYPTGSWEKTDDSRQIMYGYTLGIGLQQFQRNRFQLTTRLLFERKGYATKYSNVDSIGNLSEDYNKQKFNYYTLSVLPSYTLGAHQRSKLMVGAYVSLLSYNAFTQEVFLNGQFLFSYFTNNVKGRFDNYDYGISFGMSHTRSVSSKIDVGFQLLGNLGLNNIVPDEFNGVIIRPCSLNLTVILMHKP